MNEKADYFDAYKIICLKVDVSQDRDVVSV
jgi:hypothetical protein